MYTAADVEKMLGKTAKQGMTAQRQQTQTAKQVTADDVNSWIQSANEQAQQAKANSAAIRRSMTGGTAENAVPLSGYSGAVPNGAVSSQQQEVQTGAQDFKTWAAEEQNGRAYDALAQAIRKNRVAELYSSGMYQPEQLDRAYEYYKENPAAGEALISGAKTVGKDFVGNIATLGEGISNIQQRSAKAMEELERVAKEQAEGTWTKDTEQTKQHFQQFREDQGPLLSENSIGAEMARQAAADWQEATKGIRTPAGMKTAEFARSVAGNLPSMGANLVLPGSGLYLMAAGAAGGKLRELDERGIAPEEALVRAGISGGIEYVTEKLPLEKWMDMVKTGGGKKFLVEMLKNMGVEGGEEAASYLGNWIVDKAFQDPEAEFSWKELLQSAAMGAASGGVYAGIGKALNTIGRAATGNLMQEADTDTVQDQVRARLNQAGVDADQQTAGNLPPEARALAERILAGESGEKAVQGESEGGKAWVPPIETELEQFVKKSMENAKQQKQAELKKAAVETGGWKQQTFDAIDNLSKKSGLAVEYINDPAAAQQGQDAYIRGKTMTINLASETAGVSSAVHETVHAMKAGDNGQAYRDFRDMIWKYVDNNGEMLQIAANVEATYTAEDSPARASILNEDGTINQEMLDEEITCKLAEELCGNPDALVEAVAEDRGMAQRFLDFIRGIKNSIAIGLTNSQKAMLDESERRLVNLLRGEAGEVGGEKFSVSADKAVELDSDGNKLTKKQLEYFKNSAVRDDDGNLRVVYHGTDAEFTVFDKTKGRANMDIQGLFFSPYAEDAEGYGGKVGAYYLNIKNPASEGTAYKALNRYKGQNNAGVKAREYLESLGYDGVYNGYDEYIAFDSNQIKRIDNKRPSENDDVRKSLRTTKNADLGGARTWAEYQAGKDRANTTPQAESVTQQSQTNQTDPAGIDAGADLLREPVAKAGQDTRNVTEENRENAGVAETAAETAAKPGKTMDSAANTKSADADSGEKTDLQSSAKSDGQESDGQDIEGLWQTAKSKANQSRMENIAVQRIANEFEVPRGDSREYLKPIVHELAQEIKRTGSISTETADRLFEEAYEKGIHVEDEFYQQYKDLKDIIKSSSIYAGQILRDDSKAVAAKKEMSLHSWAKFDERGVGIDTKYAELREMAPELFPAYIEDPGEKLIRIRDVVKSIDVTRQNLDAYYGSDAEDFRMYAREKFYRELDSLKADIDHIARAERDNWAARQEREKQYGEPMTLEQATAEWKKVQDLEKKAAKAVSKANLTRADNAIVDRLLKGETTLENIKDTVDSRTYDDIERVYNAKREAQEAGKGVREYGKQLAQNRLDRAYKALEGSELWTDKGIGTTRYDTTTAIRNMRDISQKGGQAAAQAVYEGYFEPVIDNTTKKIRWQKKWNNAVNDLKLNKWESQYLQIWGELKGIDEAVAKGLERNQSEKDTLRLELDKLIEEHGDKVNREKVEREAYNVFRNFYDEAYRMTNEALVRNGYQPMEYRAGYFPHFNDQKPDGFMRKALAKLGIGTAADNLPTAIAGTTDTRKPGRRYNQFNQRRTGYNTEYNALEGFERYIDVAGDSIFHGDDIRNLRALESAIRYKYSDEGIRQRIEEIYNNDSLTESERENLLTEAWDTSKTHMSNFVQWVNEYTNLLAGKKDRFSRAIEQQFGRGIYRSTRTVQNRLAGAQIAGNISSAMTNFIPISQLTAEVSTKNIVQAMAQTVKAGIQGDELSDISDFIARREGAGSIKKGIMDTVSDVAGKGFEIVDGFASNVVVRAKYLENIENGMSAEMAMNDADNYAAGLMADRSQGSLPTIYQKNNPLMKMFTLYQVEVKNQFDYMIKDLPVNVKNSLGTEDRKRIIANVAWGLTKTAIWAYLLNDLYEILTGRRPALDPLDILNEAVGDFAGYKLPNTWEELGKAINGEASLKDIEARQKKKSAAAFNLAENVAEEVPFVGGMLGGGRIPMVSSFDGLKESGISLAESIADGDTAGMKKAAANTAANAFFTFVPGGGQMKKTANGIKMMSEGGLYTGTGDKRRLRTTVEQSPGNWIQAGIFGKGANKDVREYYDSGDDGLSAKQTTYWENGSEGNFGPIRDTGVSFKVFNAIMDFNSKATADKDINGVSISGSKKEKVAKYIKDQLKEDGFTGKDLTETAEIIMVACGYKVEKKK